MADKYDKNGYNSSDFKRNSNQDSNNEDEKDGEGVKLNEKASEYMRELLSEKIKIDVGKLPVSARLLDQEVTRLQASGRIPAKDGKYVDVYREKPTKVVAKVLLPVKEHPKFNFVGKLLGPKGNTLKQLQEETMCKMAVLGRGSMRDRQKEEELRNSLDPKYSHLTDELHVEISALAPPAEAHARLAYALAEVKKYIIPDAGDVGMMRGPPPMRDMMEGRGDGGMMRGPPPMRDMDGRGPREPAQYSCQVTRRSRTYEHVDSHAPGGPRRAPPRPPGPPPRPLAKTKVISILDRARSAMDGGYGYEEGYGAPEPPQRGPPRGAPEQEYYGYETAHGHARYYEDDYYKEEAPGREYKPAAREVGTRRAPAQRPHQQHFARSSPYSRPNK